jgi:hypothetical protein
MKITLLQHVRCQIHLKILNKNKNKIKNDQENEIITISNQQWCVAYSPKYTCFPQSLRKRKRKEWIQNSETNNTSV